ncbi:G protein-coupled glucose receptor regulating Gpa2-domain-containing protein [Chaetomium sp. MPI-CAGE-AT-0009]|nr:G protein-coupled glucose receptor regulating Gpa2-domain-containing protein [Chaetomium sp. MPI-CAGE-AT-0009]
MTVPRWMFPGTPLDHLLSDGIVTSEIAPIAARHPSAIGSDQHIVHILLILSVTFASISVLSTLFALYWLILLLIRSDCAKSIVLVIFAIVSFVRGGIRSDSAFCQISGFALAVGIESSDIAVLLIALHSAMYIFRPRAGLYPYRRRAYLGFYLYPILAACLAFIGGNGYENMGPYCYLRTDRSWARLGLSWVPRYIICASIVVIYVSIYFYIRRKMGDYGRRRSEAMQPQPLRGSIGSPWAPRLRYNGLLFSALSSRRTSATDTIGTAKDPLRPPSSIGPAWPASARTSVDIQRPRSCSVKWNWHGFTHTHSPEGSGLSGDDSTDPISPASPTFLSPPAAAHTPRPSVLPSTDANTDIINNNHYTGRASPPRPQRQATPDAGTDDEDAPDSSPILSPTGGGSASPFITITSPEDDDPAQTRQQKKTLRQLRSLFAYPLVYIILWLFPFVSHVLGYDDDPADPGRGGAPPHWLLVVSIVSLSVQGAVDCVLFLLRETPWRHARGRAFWPSLGRRWASAFGCRGGDNRGPRGDGVGRTREEMLVYGRLARERREGEVVVERERGVVASASRAAAGREWWDGWAEGEGRFDDDDHDDVDDGDVGGDEEGGIGREGARQEVD